MSQSATMCGRCDHPMHWRECGADMPTTEGGPWCACRNDIDALTPAGWDELWDPRSKEFVPRQRRAGLGGLVFALAVTAVFWLAVGFCAGRASAAGPSEPAPEPSFVPVPGATMPFADRSAGPGTTAPAAIPSPTAPAPAATPRPTPKPTPRPKPAPVARGPVIRGSASWCAPTPRYCHGWGGTARLAAVPTFHYGDRPYLIRVCAGARCVTATVVSFCACRAGRIVDLTPYLFRQLAPLDRGVVAVTVRRL